MIYRAWAWPGKSVYIKEKPLRYFFVRSPALFWEDFQFFRTYHAEVQFYVNPVSYQKIDSHVRSAFSIILTRSSTHIKSYPPTLLVSIDCFYHRCIGLPFIGESTGGSAKLGDEYNILLERRCIPSSGVCVPVPNIGYCKEGSDRVWKIYGIPRCLR